MAYLGPKKATPCASTPTYLAVHMCQKIEHIGFNHTTINALRKGDKETPENARRQFPE
jgi:hypothetical protein